MIRCQQIKVLPYNKENLKVENINSSVWTIDSNKINKFQVLSLVNNRVRKNRPNIKEDLDTLIRVLFEILYRALPPHRGARGRCWAWTSWLAGRNSGRQFPNILREFGLTHVGLLKLDNVSLEHNPSFPYIYGIIHSLWFGKFCLVKSGVRLYVAIEAVCRQEKNLIYPPSKNQGTGGPLTNIEERIKSGNIPRTNVVFQLYFAFNYPDLENILKYRYGNQITISRTKIVNMTGFQPTKEWMGKPPENANETWNSKNYSHVGDGDGEEGV
jgi:hypothetical protein